MSILEKIFNEQIDKPKYPPSDPNKPKSPSIKPSSLGTPCMRKLYYSYNKVPEDYEFPLSAKRIMKLGDAIHDMLGDVYRRAGILIDYYNKDGKYLKDIDGTPDLEFPIKSKELEIKKGKIDAVMVLDNSLWLGEYKSINENGFNKLVSPKPDHFIQGITYLYVFNKMLADGEFAHIKELKDFKKAEGIKFLYVNKNNTAFKEFSCTTANEAFINIVNKIQNIKTFSENKQLPDKTPDWCNSCPWRTKCKKNYNI